MNRCMGAIQKYWEYTDIWGCTDMGCHTDGSQTYRQPDIPPHVCQLHLGTIFLIKFKFIPYWHILLAYQLAKQHNIT